MGNENTEMDFDRDSCWNFLCSRMFFIGRNLLPYVLIKEIIEKIKSWKLKLKSSNGKL